LFDFQNQYMDNFTKDIIYPPPLKTGVSIFSKVSFITQKYIIYILGFGSNILSHIGISSNWFVVK